jgi:hypothetical protein
MTYIPEGKLAIHWGGGVAGEPSTPEEGCVAGGDKDEDSGD